MTKENALTLYESMARPPIEALKQIGGGKLKGKTDINPQWRYKVMTEKFGLVGIGWKYDIQKLWTVPGAGNESLAFAQVAVYVKDGDTWSDPVVGIGGSKLVQTENGNAVSNDEGYKMAVTDAFSTALKMLGVAADIYAGLWDGSKYKDADSKSSENDGIPQQVQTVANAFNGNVRQENENTEQKKKLYDLGSEAAVLLKSLSPQNQPVFNEQEKKEWQESIQNKYKAKDLTGLENVVKQLKEELMRRVSSVEAMPPEQAPAQFDIF